MTGIRGFFFFIVYYIFLLIPAFHEPPLCPHRYVITAVAKTSTLHVSFNTGCILVKYGKKEITINHTAVFLFTINYYHLHFMSIQPPVVYEAGVECVCVCAYFVGFLS